MRITTFCNRLLILIGLFFSATAWSSITINPSPSYSGSYTVEFSGFSAYCASSCYYEENVDAVEWKVITELDNPLSIFDLIGLPRLTEDKTYTIDNKLNGIYSYRKYSGLLLGTKQCGDIVTVDVKTPGMPSPIRFSDHDSVKAYA